MRSGACTLQQTLTSEAASILKHSLSLARRRGHAQVTPLHVAATLLTLRASSLRRACLKTQPQPPQQNYYHHHYHTSSYSHPPPLHCRALELCFNVALNRLPTTPTPPLLHNHHHQPSLSNALIAALKRAQAHQRRGCIEQQQQQPLLAVKVELEQLIISILDDPSVSRVMREAGFSSTAVKNNLEEYSSNSISNTSSVFQCYNNNSSSSFGDVFLSPSEKNQRENSTINPLFLGAYSPPLTFSPQKKALPVCPYPISHDESLSSEEDIKLVLDVLLRKKKRNTVIVGDSTESLVGEIMRRFERGEVPEELKSTHFIKFQLAPSPAVSSLKFMKREEVEMNMLQLKRKVESYSIRGGAIFYVGDLKWTVDAASLNNEKDNVVQVSGYSYNYYNPVDHIVAEIAKLFCENNKSNNSDTNKVWLLATASYQTYMRCQMRQPPLETQWCLQAVPVPSAGLGLTLHASSAHDTKMDSRLFSSKEEQDRLNCCEECATNYEKEAQLFKPGQKNLLPSWLQSHSTETHHKDESTQLKKKWNRLCQCLHQNKQPQNQWSNSLCSNNHSTNAKIFPYNSTYPWWPNQGSNFQDSSSSISFADSVAKSAYSSSNNNVPRFRHQQSCTIEFNFNDVTQKKQQPTTTTLDSLKGMEGKEVKITLALGNSTFGGSGQKTVENLTDHRTHVRAHICKLLQENVPWQSETLASIAEVLVDSKSAAKKESAVATCLFLQGNDSIGKTRLAYAIAESLFDSADVLLHLDMLKKENLETPLSEMLAGTLKNHGKFVFLVQNVDFADTQVRKFLADGFEAAKFETSSKKDENSGQAIFIFTNGGTGNRISEDDSQNKDSVIKLILQISETKPTLDSSSPCLGQKRKAELYFFTKIKNPRIEEKEERVLFCDQSNKKKEFSFSRQSSFNTLDLNMKADEEDDREEEEEEEEDTTTGENSPISSDLTRETIAELDSIENRFEFNQTPIKEKEMEEMFLSKIKESFKEVFGVRKFSVEERVIKEIGGGCGSFTNSMFEKWLKDIFQTSLLQTTVSSSGGKEGIVFTLCWGGKEDKKWGDSGFMGSCLPKNVQVNYFMD